MSFPRYPKYKPSGVEWLGDVPEHWGSGTLRWLSRRYSGGTPDRDNPKYWEEGTIPWLNSGAVNDRLICEPSAMITHAGLAGSSAKWIPRGALVMALAGQGRTKGTIAQLGFASTCNQSMAAIIPGDKLDSRFLFWWLDSSYQNIRNMAGGDLRDGLNLELLGAIPCPIPHLPEQRAIAAFLDRETAKIDGLVAEQQQLIEFLKEKRQAVISHAVTRGLDPKAPMKPSGVEWLGDVPAHWAIVPMRYCVTRTASGGTPESGRGEFWDTDGTEESTAWVAIGDMTAAQVVTSTERRVTSSGIASKRLEIFPTGTILYSMYASLGKVARLGLPAAINQAILAIEPNAAILHRDYLCYWLNHVEPALESLASSSTQSNLNAAKVRSLPIAVSTLIEQRAIAAFLDRETAKIDGLVTEAESAITLLQERRSALISAAVTGQIDVRNAVATEAA